MFGHFTTLCMKGLTKKKYTSETAFFILQIFIIKDNLEEGYDVTISAHEVTNKVVSRDSNYFVDMVVRPKFGNSSISLREVTITSIL